MASMRASTLALTLTIVNDCKYRIKEEYFALLRMLIDQ